MATCPSCGGSGNISDEQFKKDFNNPNIKISGQGQGIERQGNARWEWVWDGAEWKQRFNSGGSRVMGAASPGPAPTTPGTTVGQVWGQGEQVSSDYQKLPAPTPIEFGPFRRWDDGKGPEQVRQMQQAYQRLPATDVNGPAYQAKLAALAAAKESSQAKRQVSRYIPLTPPQIKQQDYAKQLVENRRKGMSNAYPSSNTSPSQYSFGQPTTQDKKRTSINTHLARMTGQGTY